MGEVISILTRQPIITANDAIRITSASKPEITAIKSEFEQQLDWLKMHGWTVKALFDGISAAAKHKNFMYCQWMPYQEAVWRQENVNMERVLR